MFERAKRALKRALNLTKALEQLESALQGFAPPTFLATTLGELVEGTEAENASVPLWVVRLAPELAANLAQISKSVVGVFNEVSPDLMSSRTYVELLSDWGSLIVDAGVIIDSMRGYREENCIVVLYKADSEFRYQFLPKNEEFLLDLQAAQGSSGFNYNPYRLMSNDELTAAAGLGDEPEASIEQSPTCLLLTPLERLD